MQTYEETLARLARFANYEINRAVVYAPGTFELGRMVELLARLGNSRGSRGMDGPRVQGVCEICHLTSGAGHARISAPTMSSHFSENFYISLREGGPAR